MGMIFEDLKAEMCTKFYIYYFRERNAGMG